MNASQYSSTILQLYQRIKKASIPGKRAQLMLQLAHQFHAEHDMTDASINDGYHAFFEEYEHVRLDFQQVALKLARLAITEIEDALGEDDSLPEGTNYDHDETTN